jgi:hypothetical protein
LSVKISESSSYGLTAEEANFYYVGFKGNLSFSCWITNLMCDGSIS